MKISSLVVKNFRALEDIQVSFDARVNVIVGPNAVGKTTLLEAIRLTKALLAPRVQNEAMQALVALGALSPHNPQEIFYSAVARDPSKAVEIRCFFDLTTSELGILEAAVPQMVTQLVLARMGQGFANPATAAAMLSTPDGQQALRGAEKEFSIYISDVRAGKQKVRLDLTIEPVAARVNIGDALGPPLISFLDRRNSPDQTAFSYFPADRAMPAGEQPVQLGSADAIHQLESYVSQPQMKYTRLKNTIFSCVVRGPEHRTQLEAEFGKIFAGILRGRRLTDVGISKQGLLSIRIQDTETGREFDIDGMSSGEKGLILTFLLIGRSMAQGSIVLLDEPELHLNPAVCKGLLDFLVQNYVRPKDLQVIICSHSPEILAGAFDADECSLYHLVSESVISKVRYQDHDEVSEALAQLGTSESEGLLYRATIFVEGDDDADLLELGFSELLRRYQVKDLGGRREVEKQIARLQEAEKRGEQLTARYFIFDRDDEPTRIENSETVRVLQWDRRCLENYLIDFDVLADFLKNPELVKAPLPNEGEVMKLLRELALAQMDEVVSRKVYAAYRLDGPGLRTSEVRGKQIPQIATALFQRLARIKDQVCSLEEKSWEAEFASRCEESRKNLAPVWETRWAEICDGKQLMSDLFHRLQFKLSIAKLKKRIMQEMSLRKTANWRAVEGVLKSLLEKRSPINPRPLDLQRYSQAAVSH